MRDLLTVEDEKEKEEDRSFPVAWMDARPGGKREEEGISIGTMPFCLFVRKNADGVGPSLTVRTHTARAGEGESNSGRACLPNCPALLTPLFPRCWCLPSLFQNN